MENQVGVLIVPYQLSAPLLWQLIGPAISNRSSRTVLCMELVTVHSWTKQVAMGGDSRQPAGGLQPRGCCAETLEQEGLLDIQRSRQSHQSHLVLKGHRGQKPAKSSEILFFRGALFFGSSFLFHSLAVVFEG